MTFFEMITDFSVECGSIWNVSLEVIQHFTNDSESMAMVGYFKIKLVESVVQFSSLLA
jgi:hypothetical protein